MNNWNGEERRQNSDNFARKEECNKDLVRIEADIKEAEKSVKDLASKIEEKYLTKELFFTHFKPIRNLLYGAVGLILVSVAKWVLALMGLVK